MPNENENIPNPKPSPWDELPPIPWDLPTKPIEIKVPTPINWDKIGEMIHDLPPIEQASTYNTFVYDQHSGEYKMKKKQQESEDKAIDAKTVEAMAAGHWDYCLSKAKSFGEAFAENKPAVFLNLVCERLYRELASLKSYRKLAAYELPPSPESVTNPREIVTALRNRFPTSPACLFCYMPGAGWIHVYESSHFIENFWMSEMSNKWFSNEIPSVTIQLPEHSDNLSATGAKEEVPSGFIDSAVILGGCSIYFLPSDGFMILGGDFKTIWVPRLYAASNSRKCDYSGNLFLGMFGTNVKKSQKYKVVYSGYVGDSSDKPFRECKNCGHVFEFASMSPVNEEQKPDGGAYFCAQCAALKLYPNVIQPYNGKKYPSAIPDFFERRGHKKNGGGEIVATMKLEKVAHPRLYGVEVETEFDASKMKSNNLNRRVIAVELLKFFPSFIAIKEDGSLTMNGKYNDGDPSAGMNYAGFEIVTAPAGLKVQKDRWAAFANFKYYKFFRAWDTDTCGFHVHVSRASLTSLQIGRMLMFVNHKYNKKFIEMVAGRSEKKFTRYIPKNVSDVLYPEHVINPDEGSSHDMQRRVALNIGNEHTVEFRIFRGTVNASHIVRNIEFCEAVCNFCAPAERSMIELNHPKFFCNYISGRRKEYPELARWMSFHGLIERKLVKLKPHSEPEESEDKTNEPVLAGTDAKAIVFNDVGWPSVYGVSAEKKKAVIHEAKLKKATKKKIAAEDVCGDFETF